MPGYGLMLSDSPRFNASRRYGWVLLSFGAGFALLGLLLLGLSLGRAGALLRYLGGGVASFAVPRALGYLGAALCAAAAAFLSSAILCVARQRHLAAELSARGPPAAASPPGGTDNAAVQPAWRSAISWLLSRLQSWIRAPEWIGRWPPPLIATLFAALALTGVIAVWRLPVEPAFDPLTLKLVGAALVAAAFPLLALERYYATLSAELLPEAPQLERLLRLPLTACLALALELILRSIGFAWALRLERLTGVLIGIVSLEVLLRCVVVVFVPIAPIERRQSLADSAIAGAVLRLRPPSLRSINIAVRSQLGIDLSRSWALGFIQKAALPVLLGIGLFAWGVTGVTTLRIDQRGIYERFGVPVAVFGPGLHFHLPWPLGAIRPTELGVVHLLPIEFLLPGGAEAARSSNVGGDESQKLVAAEALAPRSANRLWTDDHPFEGSYIIASEEGGRQSFQLVNIDMAVMYRVGLSEDAARDAAYRVTGIDELIQALSGQLLVRYFTHNTLLDLLGQSRETFSRQFQSALQEQLDHFATGVEAIGVSVEAIHPPPGAADAYHDVQAAEIIATTQISLRRGESSRTLKSAQRLAGADRNEAVAAAAERVSEAQSQSVLFAADRQAYAQDGYPFLLERWLDDVAKGLAGSRVVLIDHRLAPQNIPALDLRAVGGLAAGDILPAAAPFAPPPAGPQTPAGPPVPTGEPLEEDER
jgi:regulator of protease activity HflC (stomatin/prohibitin superfamily)